MDSAIKHVQNYWDLGENRNLLKRKLEELNAVKEDEYVKSIEQLQPRKRLKRVVQHWFQEVERINKDISDLENDVRGSNLLSFCGGKVIKMINKVDKLLQQCNSFDCLVTDDPQWVGQILPTTALIGDVPKKIMEEIWKYLIDDKVSKIGIWGMGGVGKTTIMKLINNQLIKETGMFNKVIWITVSNGFDITKLQNDIEGALKVSLFVENDDETIRAGKLYECFGKLALKGKYVLILDDLWVDLSLEVVGIPEPSNGSKLVVTTRSLDVCHYLGCQEIKIPTLTQLDAWNLFLEKVGKDVEACANLSLLVRSVADECDGLPLAIVTIASSMRKVRDACMWRNALCELKEQVESVDGKEEKIFQKLQFSYDHLGNERLKLCFLCCALYPEDFNIKIYELINLWIAEGYLEEMNSVQAEIDRGLAILNKLKNICLIEQVTSKKNNGKLHCLGTVKLHDIVRNMALRIIRERPQFYVRPGRHNTRISLAVWKEGLEKISLIGSWRLEIPPQMFPPNFPALTTLLLSDCKIKSIPDHFFAKMRGLKVLDLSRNGIWRLPNSISDLECLTTLLLCRCWSLIKMPSFSKLKALKRLDLSYTGIIELPHRINELINLRYLNLSFNLMRMYLVILANLPSLVQLEVVNVRRVELHERIGSGELLAKLELFDRIFNGLNEFNSYTQALEDRRNVEGPPHYKFAVCGRKTTVGCKKADMMNLVEDKFILFEQSVILTENIKLPSNVERLEFRDIMNGRVDEECLSNLLTCCGNASFFSLKKIYVFSTDKNDGIKTLFSLDWALLNLQNLEELIIAAGEIVAQPQWEEIIGSKSTGKDKTIKVCTLPRLRKLRLVNLPELKSICDENVTFVCDSIEKIVILSCPKLKRIPLIFPLGTPPSLKKILISSKEWWESVEFGQPDVKCTLKQLLRIRRFLIKTTLYDSDEEDAEAAAKVAKAFKAAKAAAKADKAFKAAKGDKAFEAAEAAEAATAFKAAEAAAKDLNKMRSRLRLNIHFSGPV